jgi:hypothetical protein
MSFNITPPLSIAHLFGNWLNGVVKSKKANIRVGVCAILSAIRHVRNDFIFNKLCFPSFLQVIPVAVCGPISSRRSSARPWIPGATVSRR